MSNDLPPFTRLVEATFNKISFFTGLGAKEGPNP